MLMKGLNWEAAAAIGCMNIEWSVPETIEACGWKAAPADHGLVVESYRENPGTPFLLPGLES